MGMEYINEHLLIKKEQGLVFFLKWGCMTYKWIVTMLPALYTFVVFYQFVEPESWTAGLNMAMQWAVIKTIQVPWRSLTSKQKHYINLVL